MNQEHMNVNTQSWLFSVCLAWRLQVCLAGSCWHKELELGWLEIGLGNISGFLWLVLSWKPAQKIGKLAVIVQSQPFGTNCCRGYRQDSYCHIWSGHCHMHPWLSDSSWLGVCVATSLFLRLIGAGEACGSCFFPSWEQTAAALGLMWVGRGEWWRGPGRDVGLQGPSRQVAKGRSQNWAFSISSHRLIDPNRPSPSPSNWLHNLAPWSYTTFTNQASDIASQRRWASNVMYKNSRIQQSQAKKEVKKCLQSSMPSSFLHQYSNFIIYWMTFYL